MKSAAVMILSASALVALGTAVWYVNLDSTAADGYSGIANARPPKKIIHANHVSEHLSHSGIKLSGEDRAHFTDLLSSAYTDSRYGRLKQIVEFLGAMTADNFPEMLEIAESAWQARLISDEDWQWCNERAGEVGGLRAVEAARASEKAHAYTGWAKADPAAVRAYITAMPKGKTRNNVTWSFLKGAAIADVNGSLLAMRELPSHHQAGIAKEMASSPDARGYEHFLRKWLDANGEVPLQEKSAVLDKLMQRCGMQPPDGDGSKLMRWLEPFAGRPYAAADRMSWLGEALCGDGRNLATTAEWLSEFSKSAPETALKTFRRIFEQTPNSTAAATQWLRRNQTHPCYDEAVIGFLSNSENVENLDLQSFDAWADTLTGDNAKTLAKLLRNQRS